MTEELSNMKLVSTIWNILKMVFKKSREIKKKELVEIEITAVNCYEEIY